MQVKQAWQDQELMNRGCPKVKASARGTLVHGEYHIPVGYPVTHLRTHTITRSSKSVPDLYTVQYRGSVVLATGAGGRKTSLGERVRRSSRFPDSNN